MKALALMTYLYRKNVMRMSRFQEDIYFPWFSIGQACILTNSTINPLVYSLLNVKYRKEYKRVFCCRTYSTDLETLIDSWKKQPKASEIYTTKTTTQ